MHGANVAEIVKKLISVLRKRDDDLSNIFLEALKRVGLLHLWNQDDSNCYFLAICNLYMFVNLCFDKNVT